MYYLALRFVKYIFALCFILSRMYPILIKINKDQQNYVINKIREKVNKTYITNKVIYRNYILFLCYRVLVKRYFIDFALI